MTFLCNPPCWIINVLAWEPKFILTPGQSLCRRFNQRSLSVRMSWLFGLIILEAVVEFLSCCTRKRNLLCSFSWKLNIPVVYSFEGNCWFLMDYDVVIFALKWWTLWEKHCCRHLGFVSNRFRRKTQTSLSPATFPRSSWGISRCSQARREKCSTFRHFPLGCTQNKKNTTMHSGRWIWIMWRSKSSTLTSQQMMALLSLLLGSAHALS